MAEAKQGPSWIATLAGALLLIVAGFGIGLVAGAAYEEPSLVAEHLAGGATEVVVNDSPGSQRNLLPEDLDPRARLISHSFKRHGMMEGLDSTFTAVVFVGYHARAGAPRGLFAHTGSGVR